MATVCIDGIIIVIKSYSIEIVIESKYNAGGSPLWKQSISIPFRPPQDDFTPPNLEQVRDDVIFTLFDEVFENDSKRGGNILIAFHFSPHFLADFKKQPFSRLFGRGEYGSNRKKISRYFQCTVFDHLSRRESGRSVPS